ncbi:MAG: hypothetical protein ACXWE4_02655 [Methylobacter sp.]
MKSSIQILIGMTFIALAACSTQEVKHDEKAVSTPNKAPAITEDSSQSSGPNPPMTRPSGDKTLNLVKIMDGGACKNDFQGVKGAFLVYADSTDIDRIKHEKGTQIFSEFESKIQNIATQALQEAINATNLAEDPFALGADEAQEKLSKQLSKNFRSSIADPVKLFQNETTLTIDIVPFAPSLIFYQQGCEATHQEPEN